MSATERLRTLEIFRRQNGIETGDALRLLKERYSRIEGWWCSDCEAALRMDGVAAHEAEFHRAITSTGQA